MEHAGNFMIFVMMGFVAVGAIAAIRNDQQGLGKEFVDGIYSIGPIFLPVAGIMASIPYLSSLIQAAFGPAFALMHAHPALAATTIIAVDMGGYHLAYEMASGNFEQWILASVVGYMAGATIVFSVPVGLAMIARRDHKYMALGVMSGILGVPVGVLTTCSVIAWTGLKIRTQPVTTGDPSYALALDFPTIFQGLAPLVAFCITLAVLLRWKPDWMIRLFLALGRVLYAAVVAVLALSVIEHFTQGAFGVATQGVCSALFTWLGLRWEFDPITADRRDLVRALEVAGYIGMMLAGAFPMVYLIKQWLAKPIESLGARIGLEAVGAAGLLASSANILAMFRLVGEMRPKDKVINIAFAVCAAFLLGDHLAFTANFQPTLVVPIILGKLAGGLTGILLAHWLSVPIAERLGQLDEDA